MEIKNAENQRVKCMAYKFFLIHGSLQSPNNKQSYTRDFLAKDQHHFITPRKELEQITVAPNWPEP